MIEIEDLKPYKHIHLIGIGGVSMSGIAEILHACGFIVTGSDASQSENTDRLIKNHIPVKIGHDLENLEKANLVVYSAAINKDDVELVRAQELNIPMIERGTFLGILTKSFKNTICVSGTHGKTTTTSMISLCFLEAGKDPSIQVGAYLKLFPKVEVILNIDNDHLDYFGSLENIVTSFSNYIKLIPDDGLLVINWDDDNCRKIAKYTNAKVLTYGIKNENANFVARNIVFNNNGFPTFDVYYNNTFYKTITLSIPGMHNVMNALACIAVCYNYGLEREDIKNALLKYTGAHRRFEYKGSFNDVNVYDDYGHHPTEIIATSNALKQKKYNKSWVIFQPHTYSRTKNLLNDFAKALINFDNIIVTDIYAARESNTYNISSKDLVDRITSLGRKALYIQDFDKIVKYVKENAKPGDIVLTLGAGTITNIGPMLVEQEVN